MFRRILCLVVSSWCLLSVAAAQEWPRFRGPDGAGIVTMPDDPALPDTWSRTQNVVWRTDIPGVGWSSPVVWGRTVFVTAVVSDGAVEAPIGGLYRDGERPPPVDVHHWMAYAVDLDSGDIRWQTELFSGAPDHSKHLKNSFASETPVTDGERLYVYFGNVGVFCLDLDGRELWSVEWPPVRTRSGWGTGASPVLHNGRLYVVSDNDDQSFITALSAETGAEVWRTPRDEGTNWATPYVWEHEVRTEIVTTGADQVRSYDLDGRLLWQLGGLSSITVPMPFSRFGLLYLEAGYTGDRQRPVYAIRPGATGDISLEPGQTSNDYIAWHLPQGGTYNTSPLVYGDYYYTLMDRGFMTAHDARTGEQIYSRRRIAVGTGFTASPWAYNGQIFAMSEEGETFVIRAGSDFEVLHTNDLDEFTLATPAIVDASLIIRTHSALYRIAE
ncbi:MAG: PQQ-binding-like beta-propeller repeat protein [bacterium]